MVNFEQVDDSFCREWDRFVEAHPDGTLFHRWKWLEILEKAQRARRHQYAAYRQGHLVGIFPFYVKRYFLLRVAGSPLIVPDTPYMGPLIQEAHFKEAMERLDVVFRSHKTHFVRILMTASRQAREYSELPYAITVKHTHVLDLSKTVDELWKRMEGRCRTAIRKAEKSGVQVRTASDRNSIETYFEMSERLYRLQGMQPPNSKDLFYLMWDHFYPESLRLYLAEHGGKVIAAAIIVHDKDTAYYLDGVSNKDYHHLCPNNLLQWEAISAAKAQRLGRYDFVGSDLPWLAKFKMSFGGETVTYPCLEKATTPFVGFLRNLYPRYKEMMGRIRTLS